MAQKSAQLEVNGVIVIVLGLTGGIGVGKSEVANMLKDLGATIINADHEGHEAYRAGTIGWRRLVEIFSSEILLQDGEIDRKKLGDLVFSDPDARAWLNSAIHPLIRSRVSQSIQAYREEGQSLVVLDAALLFQAGWNDLCDEIWLVTSTPIDAIYERLFKRGLTDKEIKRRLEAQEEYGLLVNLADIHIENSHSIEDLRQTVKSIWTERINN
ncbi:MAG: dephospho-CoA kinase [Chloroflexi bacterium]|nr:dephospho-CoA kinase [Chloroflexota bacterium]